MELSKTQLSILDRIVRRMIKDGGFITIDEVREHLELLDTLRQMYKELDE